MPTRVYSVGTSEVTPTELQPEEGRTAITVQNLDTTGTDYAWISDQKGNVATTGLRIAAGGGAISIYQSDGWDTEGSWYIVATTAATPVRVMTGFKIPQVRTILDDDDDDPQGPPSPKLDAPPMRRLR